MRIIKDLELDHKKKLKHTFVQGADGNYYKILTFKLYEIDTGPEFARYEVNIQQVDENTTFRKLIVPHFSRFMTAEEALAYHQKVLDNFDSILQLKSPETKEHKKSN